MSTKLFINAFSSLFSRNRGGYIMCVCVCVCGGGGGRTPFFYISTKLFIIAFSSLFNQSSGGSIARFLDQLL